MPGSGRHRSAAPPPRSGAPARPPFRLARPSQEFRKIFGFLLGFVDKDKQAEALADRLCARLATATADDVRAARAVAFCLERLPPTDKALRKLVERRSAYAHRLSDDEVYASMCEVAAKARRTGKAPLVQAAVRAPRSGNSKRATPSAPAPLFCAARRPACSPL